MTRATFAIRSDRSLSLVWRKKTTLASPTACKVLCVRARSLHELLSPFPTFQQALPTACAKGKIRVFAFKSKEKCSTAKRVEMGDQEAVEWAWQVGVVTKLRKRRTILARDGPGFSHLPQFQPHRVLPPKTASES